MPQNNAIIEFVNEFENAFADYLVDPTDFKEYSLKPSFQNSKYFKFIYGKLPDNQLSDWDIACWLNTCKMESADAVRVDDFIRGFHGFSIVGLMTRPDNHSHLQYMAFTPNEQFAPFIDLHIRFVNGLNDEAYFKIYPGNDTERQKWLLFTAWRKNKKGENEKQILDFLVTHNAEYWSAEEIANFISDPFVFFASHFPDDEIPTVFE